MVKSGLTTSNKLENIILIFLYTSISLSALFFFTDFGIHIEEKFHRLNGLYWLNHLAKLFNLDNLEVATNLKIKSIVDYTLSPVEKYNKYGVILDLPMALYEVLLKKNNLQNFYEIKHLVSFYIFLLSSFFFFLILKIRFQNFFISLLGTLIFLTTPRIFGDSFLYKDILFLSFFNIALYFYIKFEVEKKISKKNLILFSLFTALSFNLRVFALFLPIIFLIIIFLKNFNDKKVFINLQFFLIYIILFFSFVYIFSPYLWLNPFNNFIEIFYSLKKDLIGENIKVLFNGEYIFNRYTPDNYLIIWIFVTTPLIILFFFIIGLIFYSRKFFKRILNIKEQSIHYDLWRGKNEKIDFTIYFIFISIFFSLLIFNSPFYNGWRLIYFFNIFIIYFLTYGINLLIIFFKKKIFRKFINFILILILSNNLYNLIIFHPFQSMYFNKISSKDVYNKYEIDYYGLSGKKFFQYIDQIDNSSPIKIAVASHTPLHRSIEILDSSLKKKFIIVGQEYLDADFIYKNNISEVNSKLNKKYDIPKNFDKIKEFKIQDVLIYQVYKKNK